MFMPDVNSQWRKGKVTATTYSISVHRKIWYCLLLRENLSCLSSQSQKDSKYACLPNCWTSLSNLLAGCSFALGPSKTKQTEEQMTQIHWSFYLPYLSTFSFSSAQPQHTSRCLSLCYLGVWPSCSCGSTLKVTLCTHRHCLSLSLHHHHHHHHHNHQPHTHTHTRSSSVPGPVNDIYCKPFGFAKRVLGWVELESQDRSQVIESSLCLLVY